MNFKGFIFDFNGVLWFDTDLQEEAWRNFASELTGRTVTLEELDEHMHGRNNKYFLEYLTGKELSEDETYKLTQEKEEKYRNMCLELGNEFKLSPGAKELLDFLKDNSIPRTIATASEVNNLKFFFENLNLSNWFDFDKCVYDDGKHPGKPAPDIYQIAAKNISLEPKDCIVTEDASSGIAAAHAAGIGRIYGMGSSPERAQKIQDLPGVYEVISSFEELDYREIF